MQTYLIGMMMAEETVQDLSMQGSSQEQSFKGEIFEESSNATDTQVKRNSSLSEESSNRSQISDTESMDPGLDDDDCDNDVEPDSVPTSFGSAFAGIQQEDCYPSPLKNSEDQIEYGGSYALSSESSTLKPSALEPLTVSQQISEMYQRKRQLEEANHLKTRELVSVLEQKIEMLSLQTKDLTHQVKMLKEENNRLRSTPEVEQLQENLRQAVERMFHYKSRCEKFELLQADQVVAGPDGPCSSPRPVERSEETDAMSCLQDLFFTHGLRPSSDDKVAETSEEKEEDPDRK